MRTGLITIVAGRQAYLRLQQQGIAAGTVEPDIRVVVAMRAFARPVTATCAATRLRCLRCPTGAPAGSRWDGRATPARNTPSPAAQAELLVFLDVDCIPCPSLLARYAEVADDDAVSCGTVGYLPPDPPHDLAAAAVPHPARPVPSDGEMIRGGDHRLFWSLSFAMTALAWRRVGGFNEAYTGYGGEDTDFGQRARAAGLDLHWIGGADAYHQHHPVSDPPVEHLDDILRNGARFAARWGWWPMEGWLQAFADRGLIRREGDGWIRS